jgi:hypothetical protein
LERSFFHEAEPDAQDDELRQQEMGLALGNGLFHETVGIMGRETALPFQGRAEA